MTPSDDPNPKIRHDELDDVLEHALKLQRQQAADGKAYVDDSTIDAIADSLDLPEEVLAKAQADLQRQRTKRRRQLLLVAGSLAAVASLAGLVFVVAGPGRPAADPPGMATAVPPAQSTVPTAQPVATTAPSAAPTVQPTTPSTTLPTVVVVAAPASRDLQIQVRELTKNSFSNSLTVLGTVTHRGQNAVRQLMLQAEFLGANGKPFSVQTFEAVTNNDSPLLPGDSCPFGKNYLMLSAPTRQIRLSVIGRDDAPVPALRERPLPLKWSVPMPDGVQLQAVERSRKVSDFGSMAFAYLTIAVRNVGSKPLQSLKAELRFYDRANRLIAVKERKLAWDHETPVFPGERIGSNWVESLPKAFHRYEMHVAEAT